MTRTTRLALTATLALAPALAACVDTDQTGTDQPPDDPAQHAPEIAGRWASTCVDPGTGQAIRLTFDISATAWALDYESFGDAACATPVLAVHIEGPYTLTQPSQIVPGAYEGRFGFTRKTVTPRSDGAAAFLAQACGGGTFTAGTATDIASGCAGLGAYPMTSCPADFDVVARTGDRLQFGARPGDNNMCTEERRPAALSPMMLERE